MLQEEAEVAYSPQPHRLGTVDPPEVSAPFRAGLGVGWLFLSDADRRVMVDLDLEKPIDPLHRPFLPYAFGLFPDRTIHRVYNGYW
jgi:hypothetical protein